MSRRTAWRIAIVIAAIAYGVLVWSWWQEGDRNFNRYEESSDAKDL